VVVWRVKGPGGWAASGSSSLIAQEEKRMEEWAAGMPARFCGGCGCGGPTGILFIAIEYGTC